MSGDRPAAWDEALRFERHHDRLVRCRPERPANVHALLSRAVAANPDGEAVVHGEARLSYADLDALVARLAGGLAAHGAGRGTRVALLLGNGVPFVALTYAIARLGAIGVPINVREQTTGVRHALVDSGAALLVTEEDFVGVAPPLAEAPELKHRFAVGAAAGFAPYGELEARPGLDEAVPVHEDEPATILYTSGTTGRPKGAILTGLGLVHSATTFRTAYALTPTDATIIVVPMSHVTGLVAGIHTMVSGAGKVVVDRQFDAARFLAMAQDERMTFGVLVPAMYTLFLQRAKLSDYDLCAWRIGGYGGAPMPEPTIRRLAEALPDLQLMNAYGATETTSPVTIMPARETARRRLSVGLPVPGADVRVMDEDGREVGPGEAGELWHAGPMVVPGYWGTPEATVREFVGGYWRSGDIGSKDVDGFVYVHDRKKDMINRGGYKVYTAEVEGVLQGVPGVREAAVLAKPCDVLGERVHAVVSADPGAVTDCALANACAAVLADYQRPESFTVRSDPLPRNANGKVLKRHLREALGFAAPA